jgi:membrane protein implicated in regulation of membrane protease activity
MEHFIIGILIFAALLVYVPRVLFVALGLAALFFACLLWGAPTVLPIVLVLAGLFVALRASAGYLHKREVSLEWAKQQERKGARAQALADLDLTAR